MRKHKWWKNNRRPNKAVFKFEGGDVSCLDALQFLDSLTDECADIVFLDPPFNLGKEYGSYSSDKISDFDYFEYIKHVISRSAEVLKPGGALYLYHIPRWALVFSHILLSVLAFRHWIAISMKNGFARKNALYPAHYALLYFSKGQPLHFQRPKIPAPRCRHCKEFTKDYGGYIRYVRNGINLSDVWDDLSPVRHKKFKHRSANELPIEILRRIVQISGVAQGLLVDPFAGTGTSALAAIEEGMNFACNDIEMENAIIIADRVRSELKGGIKWQK